MNITSKNLAFPFLIFFCLVISSFTSAQELEQPGYRFLKRVRGMKLLDSKIQEIMLDEANVRLAVTYKSKKILYATIYQMYSYDKINDYRFDERLELYSSYFTEKGNVLYANIDLFKQTFLKLNLMNGEVDTVLCNATPKGCQRVDQAIYKLTAKTSDNTYMIMVDDQHPNDFLVYMDQNKFNLLKTELGAELKKSITVVDIRDKLENDARKKYGTFKPVMQQSAPGVVSKPSIILTKENILTLIEKGSFENDGVVVKLDEEAKRTVTELKEKNNSSSSKPTTVSTTHQSTKVGNTPKSLNDSKFEVGEVIKLNNILFDQGKSSLLPESFVELDKLANILKTRTTMEIQVNGHTNNIGLQNMEISEKRAKSVVDYLMSKGIAESRLKYKGYGETQPIESNDTEEGRTKNRRVEIYIIKR